METFCSDSDSCVQLGLARALALIVEKDYQDSDFVNDVGGDDESP